MDSKGKGRDESEDKGAIPLESIDLEGIYTLREEPLQPNSTIIPLTINPTPQHRTESPLITGEFDELEYTESAADLKEILIPHNPDIIAGKWRRPLRRRKQAQSEELTEELTEEDARREPTQVKVEYDTPKEWTERDDPTRHSWSTIVLLLVGILGGIISSTMDITIFQLQFARRELMGVTDNVAGQYFLWLLHLLVCLWVGITLTAGIAPMASGSGIPEMKSIISGIHLKYVLGFRSLIVKIFGITLALGSGMILGKEGPFIHLCCIIANLLIRLPFFSRIRKNTYLLQIMLGAACAVGVSAHFGAPVGGVLFSIEVTTTYYPTRNYWYAYLGAVTGTTFWRYIWNSYFRQSGFNSIIITNFSQHVTRFGVIELFIFALLGCTCGVLGVLFIKLNAFAFKQWRKVVREYKYLRSPYVFAFILGTITATVTFPKFIGGFMALSPTAALADLVNTRELGDITLNGKDWTNRDIFANLFLFALTRFILIPIGIILPIPCGLFVPSLSLGASIGRMFGEAAVRILQNSPLLWEGSAIVAGAYGVVGAAAFTASVTHTLSTAVIIFEITGSNVHIVPVLIGVLAGVATARKISSLGIYESLAKLKGLPFLPDLKQDGYAITAKDFMETKVKFITKDFVEEEVAALLDNAGDERAYPVVNSRDDMLLVGTVDRETLENLRGFHEKMKIYYEQKSARENSNVVTDKDDEDDNVIHVQTALVREKLAYVPRTPIVTIRSTPIRFVEDHPLSQIHLLFVTMRLMQGFVTRNGQLKGVITRNALREIIYATDSKLTLIGD